MPSCRSLTRLSIVALCLCAGLLLAVTPESPQPPRELYTLPHELPPLDARPPRLGPRRTAPALPPEALRNGPYQSVQVNVAANGDNILADAANEPSIAVDPTDPIRMVIGWRQFDTVLSDFRQAGWAYSHTGGYNWTFPGVLETGVFRSDPVLSADAYGDFYYCSLTDDFSCRVFKSTNGGVSWDTSGAAYGGDKPWMAIDRTGGIGDGNIYCCWQRFANCCGNRTFTRSTDGGSSFCYPRQIPASPTFGVTAVGPDGEVYVAGIEAISSQNFEQFVIGKSTNAKNPSQSPSFSTTYIDLGGRLPASVGCNPGGLSGQVWVAVDHSDGPTRGYVYVLCTVERPGQDWADVMFIRSTDGGSTWSAPLRINDDPDGNWAYQWFGTLSVAPNGRIDVVWNDTRNGETGAWCEVFYAYSTDGGLTFSANEPVTPAFDSTIGWPQQAKLGDYFDMISDDLGAHLAYAATFNGEQDVYYLRLGEPDCNGNGVPDAEDIDLGPSEDCNENGIPDECELDCNGSGQPDDCDVADGTSEDCNENNRPDECEVGWDQDCNTNSAPDLCDIYDGTSTDCNGNAIPDECDLAGGTSVDCNANDLPDECDLAAGTSVDCNQNGVPDECDAAGGLGSDCQPNGILDQCEPTPQQDNCAAAISVCPNITYYAATAMASNDGAASCGESANAPDVWYYFEPYGSGFLTISLFDTTYETVLSVHTGCPGTTENEIACSAEAPGTQAQVEVLVENGNPYWIRIAGVGGAAGACRMLLSGPDCAFGPECNDNGIPDECEPDCNGNGRPDECDIADETSQDTNGNGFPDECEIPGDCNCDQSVNSFDIDPFVLALTDPEAYATTYPDCSTLNADVNADGEVNSFDIDPFVVLLTGQ